MSVGAKKPHPTAATVERDRAGAETRQATTSTTQSTTPTTSRQRISDFLGHGQNAAVPLRHLKELSGLPGREVRRVSRFCPTISADIIWPLMFRSRRDSSGPCVAGLLRSPPSPMRWKRR